MNDTGTSGRAAFFDVDYTILSSNSATLFVKYLMKRGEVGIPALLQTTYYIIKYKLNLLDFEKLAEREVLKYKGGSESDMIELCDQWFDEYVVDYIRPKAVDRIVEHMEAGDTVVLLSAATVYLVRPLARYLKIEHYLCNYLELGEDGIFTGKLRRPFCYGDGKLVWAKKLADDHGFDLADSYYYSDSITDLAVLEAFGHPVAVTPDPLLKKEAKNRGWPVLDWKP